MLAHLGAREMALANEPIPQREKGPRDQHDQLHSGDLDKIYHFENGLQHLTPALGPGNWMAREWQLGQFGAFTIEHHRTGFDVRRHVTCENKVSTKDYLLASP